MSKIWTKIIFMTAILVAGQSQAAQELIAAKVVQAPTVDGIADEAIWSKAKAVTTHESLANIDVTIKAVHTEDSIFLLVTFPDPTENRNHKTMGWVSEQKRYRTGADREDTFVIKWSMEPGEIDLSVTANSPYRADIWYWKAYRTDHAGYADDKSHIYSAIESPRSKPMISKNGRRYFLSRPGDEGSAAYKSIVHPFYVAKTMEKYQKKTPTGSRADIRAKGVWRNGRWTIEFQRKRLTGHVDDIQFSGARRYQFGIARYEIAGRTKNTKIEEPNFGSGDVTENVFLTFK